MFLVRPSRANQPYWTTYVQWEKVQKSPFFLSLSMSGSVSLWSSRSISSASLVHTRTESSKYHLASRWWLVKIVLSNEGRLFDSLRVHHILTLHSLGFVAGGIIFHARCWRALLSIVWIALLIGRRIKIHSSSWFTWCDRCQFLLQPT